jgi:hypothetical protein
VPDQDEALQVVASSLVEPGAILKLPSGDVIIGAPTAVALATPPEEEE